MKEQRVYFFQYKIITVKSGDSEEKQVDQNGRLRNFLILMGITSL